MRHMLRVAVGTMSRRRSAGGEKRKKDYRNAVCPVTNPPPNSINDSWVPFLFFATEKKTAKRTKRMLGCKRMESAMRARWSLGEILDASFRRLPSSGKKGGADAVIHCPDCPAPFDPVVSAPITSRIRNFTSSSLIVGNVTASLGIILFESPKTAQGQGQLRCP